MDEESLSAALEKLRAEQEQLESEGESRKATPVANGIKLGTEVLNKLRGKGNARNWFLR